MNERPDYERYTFYLALVEFALHWTICLAQIS